MRYSSEHVDLARRWAADHPDDPAALDNYAGVLLAAYPPQRRDPAGARLIAERAVMASSGRVIGAWHRLAESCERLGDYPAAIAATESALGLLPPDCARQRRSAEQELLRLRALASSAR